MPFSGLLPPSVWWTLRKQCLRFALAGVLELLGAVSGVASFKQERSAVMRASAVLVLRSREKERLSLFLSPKSSK